MKKISIFYLNVIIFLYSLVANFAHPITPTFIQELGLHDYMFGLAFACMSFTNFFFSPFWGKMSNKYGSAKVLSIGFFGYAIMQLFFGFSTAEWQICAARLVGGFFISAISVSQMVYVVDNSKESGKDLAKLATLNTVVAQFGFLVGGYLGEIGLVFTFVVQGISLFLIGVLTFLILKDGEIHKTQFTLKELNPFADFISCKDILNKYIVLFLIFVALATFAGTCYEQCFNYYIKDVFDFKTSYSGIVKMIIGFVCLAFNAFLTMRLIAHTNTSRSIIAVFGVMTVTLLGVIFIDSFIPFMAVNIAFFGFYSMITTLNQDLLTKHNDAKSAELVGLFNAIKMLGSVFGSLTAGFIYALGPKASFVVSAICVALAMTIAVIHLKEEKRIKAI